MAAYAASHAGARLPELLDRAERGERVVIVRRGVRFTLQDLGDGGGVQCGPRIEILDPVIESGEWSWSWGKKGLRFSAHRGRAGR